MSRQWAVGSGQEEAVSILERQKTEKTKADKNVRPTIRGFYCRLPTAYCVLILALPLTGCGYQQQGSFDDTPGKSSYKWSSLYREDIQTVAAPIFTNKDFRRGMEFRLSTAVVKQIEAHTPYRVAPQAKADTILEGEIVSVDLSTLSNDVRTNVPQEQLYVMTVNFRWKDLRSGKILVERRNFQQTAPMYGTLGEGEFTGSQQAVEKLAQAIVNEMQADW